MAYKHASRPILWIVSVIILAIAVGWMAAKGSLLAAAICLTVALYCAFSAIRAITRTRNRVDYIVEATLNEDFSYKFPIDDVPADEVEINENLNRLVEHLEHLSIEASRHEQFLSLIINLVDTGLVVADTKGSVIHRNDAALKLLSLPVLTHTCQMSADLPHLSIKRAQAALRGGNYDIFTITDIRQPIQRAEIESWEKLVRVLTHEIMNSLTPINALAGNLLDEDRMDRPTLSLIADSSRSLLDFVKRFRKYTIIPDPQPKVISIKPFLERAITLAGGLEKAKGIEFSLFVTPADALAYADETMLSLAVGNILKNAVEASPSRIIVTARIRKDESVEIRIANNGDPIPADVAAQIFTPFFTTKASGSGVGLSLSQRMIHRMSGTLTLISPSPATFSIII